MALTPSTMLALGTKAPAFRLPDVVSGKTISLETFAGTRALLVMFICRHCPYVVHVREELARIGRDYATRDIGIVAISANDAAGYPDDAPDQLKAMAKELGFAFPFCYDESQEVARAYAAACTPDFFLFDANRALAYRGQLDDSRPGNGRPLTGRDLRAAIEAVLAGKPVSPEQRPSIGCNIKWKPAQRTLVCLLALGIGLGMHQSAHAAQVKLTDGTEVTGTVVGRDGRSITLTLQRSSVASIDGKPLPAPVVEGSPAPTFSVVDLSGTTQTLGSATGEVTLLHFWASWCPHCRHDVDLMKDLFAKYQGKGVRVVTVSVDQDMKALAAFIQDQHLPYPVVAAYSTPNTSASQLPDLYETHGIPAYFLMDAHGTIAKTMSGSVTEGKVDLEGLLKELLGSKPAAVSSAKSSRPPRSGEAPDISLSHRL